MKTLQRLTLVGTLILLAAVPSNAQSDAGKQELASHLQKAQEFLHQGKPELAIPELKAASALDPDNIEVQGNLGVLLYFQGAYSEAIPRLRIAVAKQPDLAKLQGLLGIAELRTTDQSDGRKDLEAAFPQIQDKKFKIQAGLELVGLYTRSNDLESAASTISVLRKVDPANAEVLYAAYRTYSDLSSESMLALALALPDSAQMHQILAEEKTRQGDTNGAINEYHQAIAIDPNLPGIHFEFAELLNSSQDVNIKKRAEAEYRIALKSNPQDEKALRRLGEIDAEHGRHPEAFAEFSRAVELQPSDSDAQLDLAKELIEMGQSDKALAILEKTVQLEPTNAIAHYRLGTLYRQQGRTEDAKREIDLYKQYKDMKEKLRATYKELLKKPDEIRADDPAVN